MTAFFSGFAVTRMTKVKSVLHKCGEHYDLYLSIILSVSLYKNLMKIFLCEGFKTGSFSGMKETYSEKSYFCCFRCKMYLPNRNIILCYGI